MADPDLPKSPDEETDLGTLWQEALTKYYDESGTDLHTLPASRFNFNHIKAEQEHQLLQFGEHRHDKGKLDKLRSLVAQNSEIIITVAAHIANAASAAFPPSAAILTAFNYVMNASRAVTEDYDMIVSFFDIMNSFLERVSMLENRMPDEWQFRRFLAKGGRFRKWAKALIDGSDPKLKDAFHSLHVHIERFESAAMLTTLKHTLESGKKLDVLGQGVEHIKDGVRQTQIGVEKNLLLSEQSYTVGLESRGYAEDAASTSHEILTVVTRQEDRGAEYTAGLHQVLKTLDKMSNSTGQREEQLVDSGARKSIAMRALETLLVYNLDDKADFTSLESYYVNGTYSWFHTQQDVYKDFEIGKVQLLWLSGPAGIGKSTLSYTIVKTLQDEFISDNNSAVAYFFFREDKDRRFVSEMLRSCALQIAARINSYREEALADLQIYETRLRERLGNFDLIKDVAKLWELFFQTKFKKGSGRRLILILDGVDETNEKDRKYIEMILQDISTSVNNIQVLFVSDPASFTPEVAVKVHTFEMTKDLILPDIRDIIFARLRSLGHLRKLSRKTRRKIVNKLSKQADTMRYIDHMLRRFDQIGRSETAVLHQLNNLPSCTSELYQTILGECQKSRADKELVSLKKFFAWLSYTTKPLYLGCARMLWHHIAADNNFSLEEELENRCSSILRLSNTTPDHDDEQDYDDSDDITIQSDDDSTIENDGDDFGDFFVVVSFQEKGLRRYFRPLGNPGDSLRTSASSGHAIILEMIEAVLCTETQTSMDYRQWTMYAETATNWTRHLQAISPAELSEQETASVTEFICNILSNKGGSIRKMEFALRPAWDLTGPPCILGKTDEEIKKTLECLQEWAVQAIKISSSRLSGTASAWVRSVAHNPDTLFIQLAESHIKNWFASYGYMNDRGIQNCYLFAHYALYSGRHLSAVQENTQLRTYFMEHAKKGDLTSGVVTEESFIVVSRAFPHIGMTAQSYLSVAVSMLYNDLKEACLRQLDLAICQAHTDNQRMDIYARMAEVCIQMAGFTKSEGTAEKNPTQRYDHWSREAFEVLTKAAELALGIPDSVMVDDKEIRDVAQAAWLFKAQVEIMRGDSGNAVPHCRQAVKYGGPDYSPRRFNIIPSLAEAKSWSTLLEVINVLSGVSRTNSVILLESHVNEIHTAAKATGQIEYVLERYRIGVPASHELMGRPDFSLMVYWARFYHDVVGTLDAISKAKTLLNSAINAKGSYVVAEASFRLADILLDEFNGTNQLIKKKAAYCEMRDLVQRVSEFMGSEFNPSQSQTVIPLAHMARKIDPVEFQQKLEQTFEGCVSALTDEAGWNDTLSLRVLARVFALVGLEREAQIAATCQLYVLDMEIFKRENEGSVADNSSPDSNVADSDLNWNTANVVCTGCDKRIRQWAQ